MREAIRTIDEFAYGIIDKRERERERERQRGGNDWKEGEKEKDLLSLYMALRDEKGEPMSRKALRSGSRKAV